MHSLWTIVFNLDPSLYSNRWETFAFFNSNGIIELINGNIEIHGLRPLTFLPPKLFLKNLWYLFHKVENVKSWHFENNYYSLWKQWQPLTIFAKRSIVDFWQGSKYVSSSEYASDLNIQGFWICQCSGYTRVLSMPGFWMYQSSEYAKVAQVKSWYNRITNYWNW